MTNTTQQGPASQNLSSTEGGWKLVPVKPTREMVSAGIDERDAAGSGARVGAIYAAMLAAAPLPTAEPPEQITGAVNTTEAVAIAIFVQLNPGVRMTDEDMPHYEAAARAAIESLSPAILADPPEQKAAEVDPDLCDDEGCPHHGMPHVCVSVAEIIKELDGLNAARNICSVEGLTAHKHYLEALERHYPTLRSHLEALQAELERAREALEAMREELVIERGCTLNATRLKDQYASERDTALARISSFEASASSVRDEVLGALTRVRESIVLAISFLGRDHETDRAKRTVPQVIGELTKADADALAAILQLQATTQEGGNNE